jgi:predicted HicB family RNase H-like nuclease
MATATVQIAVRIAPELHAQITALALAERRSVNSEVVRALEAHVQPRGGSKK